MEFRHLLEIIDQEPVFETGLLLAGDVDPFDVRRQLSRWTASGKIYQLRRGLYSLAPPYQKAVPHPFLVANRLEPGSYVSLQSALAFYGLIPEHAPLTTSITTGRPAAFRTPLGSFDYHHVQARLFYGFHPVGLGNDQQAFVAAPEKALLDLIYLQPGGAAAPYLRELRLQGLEKLDLDEMQRLARRAHKPKLLRALDIVRQLAKEDTEGFELL